MKPIIGIIARPFYSEDKNKICGSYEEIINSVMLSGGIPITILPNNNLNEFLTLCNGFILQGGDYFIEYERKVIEYAYSKDIPLLGICLGMQHMGVTFSGEEFNCLNHKFKNKKYVHEVIIDKNSNLYKFLKKDNIRVNSRHKSSIINTNLSIVGVSSDGIVEAVEDKNKKFFIGVQWHPESMFNYDKNSRNLFKYFIKICI